MFLFVCLLKTEKPNIYIQEMLSIIFKINIWDVGELIESGSYKLRFENRVLDAESEFRVELNVYISNKEKILDLGMYNNLLFARAVSGFINEEVVINDDSPDPYQWIMISQDKIFLVEDDDSLNYGINISPLSKKELNFEKALLLLPNKSYIESFKQDSKEITYFVSSSSLWNDSLM